MEVLFCSDFITVTYEQIPDISQHWAHEWYTLNPILHACTPILIEINQITGMKLLTLITPPT